MDELSNSIRVIIPIIIFIIWIINSIMIANKNRKQVPQRRPEETQYQGEETVEEEEEENPQSAKTELRRQLETIFRDMAPESAPEPARIEPPPPMDTSSEIKTDKQLQQKKISDDRKKQSLLEMQNFYQNYESEDFAPAVSLDELRRAVFLAEILAPPVSQRE
jgi:hypothetical protein